MLNLVCISTCIIQREVFIKVCLRLAFRNIGETVVTPYNSVKVGTMNHHNVTMSPANVSEG